MPLDTQTLCKYRLDHAYRIREKCDYSDFFVVTREDSAVQLENAETFLGTVKEYLQKKGTEMAK